MYYGYRYFSPHEVYAVDPLWILGCFAIAALGIYIIRKMYKK
jgi:hypothetical protein